LSIGPLMLPRSFFHRDVAIILLRLIQVQLMSFVTMQYVCVYLVQFKFMARKCGRLDDYCYILLYCYILIGRIPRLHSSRPLLVGPVFYSYLVHPRPRPRVLSMVCCLQIQFAAYEKSSPTSSNL